MSLLNISCKKATYLVSKKEERRLSLMERITLRSHLSICSLCRRFEEQTAFIAKMAKQANAQISLSAQSRKRIQEALDKSRDDRK